MLGEVLGQHAYVPIAGLRVAGTPVTLRGGKTADLAAAREPADVTRRNVVWENANPDLVAVGKFGTLTATGPGAAEGRVVLWDDARPDRKSVV